MADGFTIDLKQLVRVFLNDPTARAEITAALDEGPAPVLTPIGSQADHDVFVRTDRDRAPGDAGFLARDADGRMVTLLREGMASAPDASTVSAQEMAKRLGVSVDELATMGAPPDKVPPK